jgi:KaiC/GvpD/RAD55 family RecA-like ATPase
MAETSPATGSSAAWPAATKTRSVTVPAPEDLELAKEDALLQLRIGRSAHLYAVLISAALALDGVILLLFDSSLPNLPASATGLAALNGSAFLLIPLAAGVAIATIGVTTKWEAFQLWPWEPHFSTTIGAFGLNVLLVVVYATRIAGVGPFAHLAIVPWFYPATLVGISVAMIGLVMTWTKWSPRQWSSALCAGLPVATSALLWAGTPSSPTGVAGLSISLFLSAILFQTSGSFLHLISSGTRPHERELITSGQSRMFRLADEVRQKEEALYFREAALVKRETDTENAEGSVRRQRDSLTEARQQLEDLEEDYRKRSDSLADKEHLSAGRLGEMDARTRQLEDKTKALELREQEVARLLPQVSTREQRLVDREAEQTRRDVELAQRKLDIDRRVASFPETEARLEARRRELDQKNADLLRREGDVMSLEATLSTGSATPSPAQVDLSAREVKLQQFKALLDEQNVTLGRRARENGERAKTAEEGLRRVIEKESSLAAREVTLQQREADLVMATQGATGSRAQYESASREYEGRLSELGRQQAELAQKTSDLDRTLRSVSDREAAIAERERRLAGARGDLDSREQLLTSRERRLEAGEAEVGLRRAEIAHGSDLSVAGFAGTAAPRWLEEPGPVSVSDRAPVASSAAFADRASPPSTPASEALRPSTLTPHLDRLPSGIPRLDDLLLGGLPARTHMVLIGDAFVGKEIVLYSFIAEGLKRGEPAILLTASRSPDEVAASLGVVLPQFREYEQLGMVTWIDASGTNGTESAHRLVTTGSDDRAGILSSLVRASKVAEDDGHVPFRFGFLGVSAVLAHGDERAGFSFLQNVVGILKPRDALAMYSLEGGALSEPQVEALLSRMDGAIAFRQDRDKTFLSVKGLGEVQTHDWVECRATNRALIIGSFALERIR